MDKTIYMFRYILPALWGIGAFNILRIVTDLTKRDEFWSGGIKLHAMGMFITIVMSYLVSYLWRKQLNHLFAKANGVPINTFKEYVEVLIQFVIILNVTVFIAENRKLIYMGDGFIDYILANAIYTPLFLLYYTFLRTEINNKNLADHHLFVEKLKADKLDTELQLLKNQYHPHFLFNALNTIYFQIDDTNIRAKKSIEQLSELLRYQIYNADREVPIAEEIAFLQSYIAFQQQRLTKRLVVSTSFDTKLQDIMLYPLIFQPLLENAFKYVRGKYEIDVVLKKDKNKLCFQVVNSLAEQPKVPHDQMNRAKQAGAGLANLRKRLDLLYADNYELHVQVQELSFIAELTINS